MDGVQGCIASLIAQKQRHDYSHLKVLVSIGGSGSGSTSFSVVASDESLRRRCASSIRAFVDQYGFDGADSKSYTSQSASLTSNNITLQLTGNIRQTLFKASPTFHSCPPYEPVSLPLATS